MRELLKKYVVFIALFLLVVSGIFVGIRSRELITLQDLAGLLCLLVISGVWFGIWIRILYKLFQYKIYCYFIIMGLFIFGFICITLTLATLSGMDFGSDYLENLIAQTVVTGGFCGIYIARKLAIKRLNKV